MGGTNWYRQGYQWSAATGVASGLQTGLISYWKMDESSTGVAPVTRFDSVLASANDLTDNNTTPSGAGKIGNAIAPAAVNSEYLSRASNTSLQTGDIDFTWSAWANSNDLTVTRSVLGKNDPTPANAEYILRTFNTLRFRFTIFNGVGFVDVNADNFGNISPSTWYFVVAWHDSVVNQLGISVNDVSTVISHTTGVQTNTNTFAIGRLGEFNGQYWDGLIDEVGFWKRVLTAAERTTLYNGGAGLTYPF